MKRLTGYTTVINPDTQEPHTFTPDDEVPDWAEKLITNPSAWHDDEAGSEEDQPNDDIAQMDRGELITALQNSGAVPGEDFPVSANKTRLATILRERTGTNEKE